VGGGSAIEYRLRDEEEEDAAAAGWLTDLLKRCGGGGGEMDWDESPTCGVGSLMRDMDRFKGIGGDDLTK